MKKIFVLLIALGLLLAVVTAAQAQNLVVLWWANGGTFTIPAGESAMVGIGWGTCNLGLTKAFMNAAHIEIILDGVPLYQVSDRHDPYWTIGPAGPYENCLPEVNAEPSAARWYYPIELPPGEYEISYAVWTDHQLTDANYDAFTGTPKFYDFVVEGTFTLIFQ